jgi:PAS domain S-box-containing protein
VIERWKPFLEIARESGKPVNTGEYRVTCSDGSVRICELYATFLADRLIVTFNDITDRKQAEEALSSSKEFLNSVIEQSPESLWVSDSEGTMIRMNLVCHELFRVTEEEAVGKYNLFKDNLIEEQGFMPLVEDVFRKGEIARFTIDYDLSRVEHIKVSGGKHRIIDVIISPIKDLSGKLTNAIILHKDVTERKRAEEELRQQTEELRASNDELELFNRAATGRELRMIELKQEINELCHRLGEPPRHAMDPLETDSVAGAGPTPAEPGGGGA